MPASRSRRDTTSRVSRPRQVRRWPGSLEAWPSRASAGLKGACAGCAEISAQHANFIVNPGGATAHDVYTLMRRAQDVVWEQAGIWLRPEIELFGRWSPDERQALLDRRVLSRG